MLNICHTKSGETADQKVNSFRNIFREVTGKAYIGRFFLRNWTFSREQRIFSEFPMRTIHSNVWATTPTKSLFLEEDRQVYFYFWRWKSSIFITMAAEYPPEKPPAGIHTNTKSFSYEPNCYVSRTFLPVPNTQKSIVLRTYLTSNSFPTNVRAFPGHTEARTC